jgi:hypothetical protein
VADAAPQGGREEGDGVAYDEARAASDRRHLQSSLYRRPFKILY